MESNVCKRLWGVVNHSPSQVMKFLSEVSDNLFQGKLKANFYTHENLPTLKRVSGHIVVLLSCQLLRDMLDKGIDLSNKTVVLIDNAVLCTQYKSIELLDATQPKSYVFKFKPLDSNLILQLRDSTSDSLVNIEECRVDIIPELLRAQPPSVLAPVMTFAYTIPNTDKRNQYLVDIFGMIINGNTFDSLSWYNPTSKKMNALNTWFESDFGKRATKALSNALNKVKVSANDEEYHILADKYNVAKFDINYAVAFIKRVKISHPNIDTKDMFHDYMNKESEEV